MAEPNLNLLSDADLLAYSEDRLGDMSDTALKYIAGEEIGATDAFTSNLSRAVGSSLEQIAGWLGATESDETRAVIQQKESEARIAAETNPVAGFAGMAVGSVLDPVTIPVAFLKPLKVGGALATGALRGAVAGTAGGAVNPVFEEFGDSRLANIAFGAGLGGVIGGAAGKLLSKYNLDPQSPTFKEDLLALPYNKKEQLLLEWNGEQSRLPAPEQTKLLEFNGKVTEADEINIDLSKPTQWNPELKSLESVETAPPSVDFTIPSHIGGQVKIAKASASGLDSIDEALWHIGGPNPTKADIALTHLTEKTGLKPQELKLMAQSARKELVRRSASAVQEGKLDFKGQPTMTANMLRNRVDPPRKVVTPITPSRIVTKDGLDPNDIELLKATGVKVHVTPNNQVQFRDTLNGNKFLNAQELKYRMNAVGIDIDIPGYRQKVKTVEKAQEAAAPEFKAEADARMAQESPETPTAPLKQETKAEVPDDLDIPPEDFGAPKQQRSVGSAGVDPKTYLGEELLPNASKQVRKKGVAREKVLLKLLENDDPRVAIPKDMDKTVKGAGSFKAAKQAGAKELRKLLEEYGNLAEFMLARKGDPRGMSTAETLAMRWYHADAMVNRAKTLDTLKDIVNRGESLDTLEVSKLSDDLVYYTGVDMFMKNDGSKLSRALNARRILSQTINEGQTPQTKMMRGLFPGMTC